MALDKLAAIIGEHPQTGASKPHLASPPIRFLPIRGFCLRYTPDRDLPLIVRVLHGARDLPEILQESLHPSVRIAARRPQSPRYSLLDRNPRKRDHHFRNHTKQPDRVGSRTPALPRTSVQPRGREGLEFSFPHPCPGMERCSTLYYVVSGSPSSNIGVRNHFHGAQHRPACSTHGDGEPRSARRERPFWGAASAPVERRCPASSRSRNFLKSYPWSAGCRGQSPLPVGRMKLEASDEVATLIRQRDDKAIRQPPQNFPYATEQPDIGLVIEVDHRRLNWLPLSRNFCQPRHSSQLRTKTSSGYSI